MCDNEVVLEQTLNQYKDELLVVVSALVCDQNNNDLIELRDKLIEIIALTEVDLINQKKTRLLAELSSTDDNSEPKASTSSLNEQKSSDNNDEDITSSSLIEALNELNGKECRVALSQQNGSVSDHNAVVMTSETIDSIDNSSEPNMSSVKVKVFFTYPMNNSMLPCPHYMSGKCRFSDKCKYSHGYEVFLKDIKPFEPIDYSTISRDSICLAKSKADSLWHKAVVEGVSDERIVIKYCDFDCVDSVDIEDILPLNDNCIESEPNFDIRLNDSINDDSNEMPVIPWNSSSSAMAEWEVHTKGIGSKLMTKMGYVWGKGLGRNGEGITQPIDVFVFPNGKSLDFCIEMKEKFLSNDELKQKIKIKQKKIENRIANGYNRVRPEDNVFDFINSKIFSLKKESSGAEPKSKAIAVKELKTSNTKSLNISSLKISEDIRKAEFELKRLNDSMLRNKTKDKVMFNQLKERVDKQNQLIQSLKHKESMIQKEQNSRNNKQKLSIF